MLRRASIFPICALALLLGGCANRRHGPQSMVVFVPAPTAAPAAELPATKSEVMVIEEPAPPPEPEEEALPPQAPEPAVPRQLRRPARPETTPGPDESPLPGTPPAEIPALAPRQSSSEETELRRQFLGLDQDIRKRLAQLNGAHLSANDQKAFDDARTFFEQATRAMADGDLARALNLAHKAGLLLAALE